MFTKVTKLWQVEDFDCNYKIFANLNTALKYMAQLIDESNETLSGKLDMYKELINSMSNDDGCIYIDSFAWCYAVDYIQD